MIFIDNKKISEMNTVEIVDYIGLAYPQLNALKARELADNLKKIASNCENKTKDFDTKFQSDPLFKLKVMSMARSGKLEGSTQAPTISADKNNCTNVETLIFETKTFKKHQKALNKPFSTYALNSDLRKINKDIKSKQTLRALARLKAKGVVYPAKNKTSKNTKNFLWFVSKQEVVQNA